MEDATAPLVTPHNLTEPWEVRARLWRILLAISFFIGGGVSLFYYSLGVFSRAHTFNSYLAAALCMAWGIAGLTIGLMVLVPILEGRPFLALRRDGITVLRRTKPLPWRFVERAALFHSKDVTELVLTLCGSSPGLERELKALGWVPSKARYGNFTLSLSFSNAVIDKQVQPQVLERVQAFIALSEGERAVTKAKFENEDYPLLSYLPQLLVAKGYEVLPADESFHDSATWYIARKDGRIDGAVLINRDSANVAGSPVGVEIVKSVMKAQRRDSEPLSISIASIGDSLPTKEHSDWVLRLARESKYHGIDIAPLVISGREGRIKVPALIVTEGDAGTLIRGSIHSTYLTRHQTLTLAKLKESDALTTTSEPRWGVTAVFVAVMIAGGTAQLYASYASGLAASSADLLLRLGAIIPESGLRDNGLSRILRATFLHVTPRHFYGNLAALLMAGLAVETYISRTMIAALFMVGVAGGGISAILLGDPNTIACGASTAIAALAAGGAMWGALLSRYGKGAEQFDARVILMICLPSVVSTLIPVSRSGGRIDHAGHIGGLIAGVLCVLVVFFTSRRTNGSSAWKTVASTLVLVSSAAYLSALTLYEWNGFARAIPALGNSPLW